MWFYLKLGFRAYFGISRKNWDFRQNIWISGARGHLKSPKKRPEIHKNARNPDFLPNPNIWKTTWEGPWSALFGQGRLFFLHTYPHQVAN